MVYHVGSTRKGVLVTDGWIDMVELIEKLAELRSELVDFNIYKDRGTYSAYLLVKGRGDIHIINQN